MNALRKVLRDPFISSTNGSLVGYLRLPHKTLCSRMWGMPAQGGHATLRGKSLILNRRRTSHSNSNRYVSVTTNVSWGAFQLGVIRYDSHRMVPLEQRRSLGESLNSTGAMALKRWQAQIPVHEDLVNQGFQLQKISIGQDGLLVITSNCNVSICFIYGTRHIIHPTLRKSC